MDESTLSGSRFDLKILRQVMTRLAEPSSTFTLHVSDGLSERIIYFVSGGIRLLSLGDRRGPDLQSYLLDQELLDVDTLHGLLEQVREGDESLQDVLLAQKILPPERYDRIVKQLLRREVLDLTLWEEAHFAFYLRAPPKEIYSQTYQTLVGNLDCTKLSEEVIAWTKKWPQHKQFLHGEKAVLSLTEAGREATSRIDGQDRLLLDLFAEPLNLRTLWLRSGLDLPQACERLVSLVKREWIAVTPHPPAGAGADLEDLIRRLEASLPQALGKELVREKLVSLYRKAGLSRKAADELYGLASLALERGDWAIAADRFKEVLKLDPEKLDALRQAVRIFVDQKMGGEAVALAVHHGRILLGRGRQEEAQEVAKLLGSIAGANLQAVDLDAAILASRGEGRSAVEQYLWLADEYAKANDRKRALDMILAALQIEPKNELLVARLNELSPQLGAARKQALPRKQTRRNRARRRVRVGSLPSAVLLGALMPILLLGFLYVSGLLPGRIPDARAQSDEPGSLVQPAVDTPDRSDPLTTVILPPTGLPRGDRAPGNAMPTTDGTSPGGRDLLEQLCPHGNRHGLISRPIDDEHIVIYGPSCDLVAYDRQSATRLFRAPGKSGHRWAVGFRAEVICRWSPGKPLWLFRPQSDVEWTTHWPLPPYTDSVAVGSRYIAVRLGGQTRLLQLDGSLLSGARVPVWDEGVFRDGLLILVRQGPSESGKSGPGLWVVLPETWSVLWSCTEFQGSLVIR